VEKNIHFKSIKRTRPVKAVKCLKTYERKNESLWPELTVRPIKTKKKRRREDDLKEIKLYAKRSKKKLSC